MGLAAPIHDDRNGNIDSPFVACLHTVPQDIPERGGNQSCIKLVFKQQYPFVTNRYGQIYNLLYLIAWMNQRHFIVAKEAKHGGNVDVIEIYNVLCSEVSSQGICSDDSPTKFCLPIPLQHMSISCKLCCL